MKVNDKIKNDNVKEYPVIEGIIGYIIGLAVHSTIIFFTWNFAIPEVLKLPEINFFQAVAFKLLSDCLFKAPNLYKPKK